MKGRRFGHTPIGLKYVADIREADLADLEDVITAVVEVQDVAIIAKASNAYIDVNTIVDDNNNLLEVLYEDNKAESMIQVADLV